MGHVDLRPWHLGKSLAEQAWANSVTTKSTRITRNIAPIKRSSTTRLNSGWRRRLCSF